eukprot:2316081-Rhodomonas_salina.5
MSHNQTQTNCIPGTCPELFFFVVVVVVVVLFPSESKCTFRAGNASEGAGQAYVFLAELHDWYSSIARVSTALPVPHA